METSGTNSDHYANSSSTAGGINSSNSNSSTAIWQGMQFSTVNPLRSLLSFVLDYSGILRSSSVTHDSDAVRVDNSVSANEFRPQLHTQSTDSDAANGCSGSSSSTGEVSIQIIGAGAQDHNVGISSVSLPFQNQAGEVGYEENGLLMGNRGGYPALANGEDSHGGGIAGERDPVMPSSSAGNGQVGEDSGSGSEGNSSNSSSYQRYDIQQVARWIEQILPFSLLLLVVFIRQHLQGFFGTIWISAIMYKSNDIVRKQTALKGDRNVSVIASYSVAFMLHIMCIYWWYQNDDLLYPLVMLPPKEIPPFWHAIFIILVNDTMVRQAAMAFKCLLLIYYKNGRGHNFRRQGQMLTLVEYTLLLYRALLPTPVWYRFFLDKDYGGLFSSLTTGLYLTFKLTSVVEKVQCFFSAIKALSRKEVHYGVYATLEQVNTAGDLCAICQEKMHSPILLRCKHVFCEECVSEWFERERTCPLCRALVKPADLRTFGDGSTSLFFQLF